MIILTFVASKIVTYVLDLCFVFSIRKFLFRLFYIVRKNIWFNWKTGYIRTHFITNIKPAESATKNSTNARKFFVFVLKSKCLRKKDTIDQTGEKKQGFASFSKRIKIKVDFLLTKKKYFEQKKTERKKRISFTFCFCLPQGPFPYYSSVLPRKN